MEKFSSIIKWPCQSRLATQQSLLATRTDSNLAVELDSNLAVEQDSNLAVEQDSNLTVGPDSSLTVIPDTGTSLTVRPDSSLTVIPDTSLTLWLDLSLLSGGQDMRVLVMWPGMTTIRDSWPDLVPHFRETTWSLRATCLLHMIRFARWPESSPRVSDRMTV